MDRKKRAIKIIIILLFIIIIGVAIYYKVGPKDKKKRMDNFDSVNINDVQNLMIVAHPDDETIWGGAHLLDGNYLVVCITCGVDATRLEEFKKVMDATNNQYIYLGYPDKTNGERDDWSTSFDNITTDLEKIYALKDWNMVVTHNPDGEYGHIHHKMTSKIMTNVAHNKENLYYFGKYYSKKRMESENPKLEEISQEQYEQKLKLIDLYVTQEFIKTTFDQMFPYENFTSYEKWNSTN